MLEGRHRDGLQRLRQGKPVLAVADTAELRSQLRTALRAIGCSEVTDSDVRQAIGLLHAQRFALVIADLDTSEMSGFDLLRTVRADPSLAGLPFVLITAAPTEQMVVAAKRLGVDGCLVKPFNLAMLSRQAALALRPDGFETDAAALAGGAAELRAGVAVLMRMIEHRLAAAELTLDENTLLLLSSYLDRAGELGLGRRYTVAFESLCSALRGAMRGELSPAPLVVRSAAAEPVALPPAAPRRELRRFRRFTKPPLQIAVLGQPHRTLDWSASGFALPRCEGRLAAGQAVEATIRIEDGEPGAALFREPILIVRNDGMKGRLSARFLPRSWTSLKLMEQLIHRRIGAAGGIAA